MCQGTVLNIQKFSIHDGPGIRTTVFLKGCPLRCQWCANPESQSREIQVAYNAKACHRCHHCIDICPGGALHADENGWIRLDESRCRRCFQCVQTCPGHALKTEGELRDLDSVVRECLQDRDFYEESGGGVTISGGEGMIQPDFVRKLTDRLHEQDIPVAIETTGCVSPDLFAELASRLDLLLFDMKHPDSNRHREGTGVGNEQILANLRWAVEHQIPVLVRIPVIPGFNSSLEDAGGFCKRLKEAGLNRVQLLPFHQMGENKYHLLQKDYAYEHEKALHPEDLQDFAQIFHEEGIEAFF